MSASLLSVKNLTVSAWYPTGKSEIIKDISFQVHHSETIAFVGRSASGKTMTALSLMGLLPKNVEQTKGEIRFEGNLITGKLHFNELRGKNISIVFQDALAALNPTFWVGTQILDVIRTHLQLKKSLAKERVLDLLNQVGLSNPEKVYKSYPHQLSGGMAQRAMLAMALSCRPKLIIADEPTSSLDVLSQLHILKLIATLQKAYKFALILISHDMNVVKLLSDSILVFKDGQTIEAGQPCKIISSPQHPYTKELIESNLSLQLPDKKENAEPTHIL